MASDLEDVISMAGTDGHFEQGRWVEDPEPVSRDDDIRIDARISTATTAVIAAMDDVASITRDLVTSEEGRQYIEGTLKDTTVQVRRSFEEILNRTKAEVDSKIKSMKYEEGGKKVAKIIRERIFTSNFSAFFIYIDPGLYWK
jgi:hypothetical protein